MPGVAACDGALRDGCATRGTQYKKVDGAWIVWSVDPAITDAQRAAWEVPPLAEAEARAAQMNARAAATR